MEDRPPIYFQLDLGKCKCCGQWVHRQDFEDTPNFSDREGKLIGHTTNCTGWGNRENFDDEHRVRIEDREWGHAHCRQGGTCGPKVTVRDIEQLFFHEFFGGRGATVHDGRWSCITHTD